MERSLPPHENASDLWPWKLRGATPCERRDPVLGAGHSNTPDHVRFVLHFSSSRLVRRLRNFDIRERTRKNRPSNFRTYFFCGGSLRIPGSSVSNARNAKSKGEISDLSKRWKRLLYVYVSYGRRDSFDVSNSIFSIRRKNFLIVVDAMTTHICC